MSYRYVISVLYIYVILAFPFHIDVFSASIESGYSTTYGGPEGPSGLTSSIEAKSWTPVGIREPGLLMQ